MDPAPENLIGSMPPATSSPAASSLFTLQVPLDSGDTTTVELVAGSALFILGANGTGKSSLVQRFYAANPTKARWLSAHRQTWFTSGAVAITGEQRQSHEVQVRSFDSEANARWLDHVANQKANAALYDLVDAQNVRAREIADAVDAKDPDRAKKLSLTKSPLSTLNDLLRLSAISVEISLHRGATLVAQKAGSAPYSIAELSDGERNVLLLAANVLTAPSGTLLLLDEPERHVHRSISSRLLSELFARRSDCAFVISTHDVMLCLDNPTAKILLARSCSIKGPKEIAWDADVLRATFSLEEQLVGEILGARRNVLFVEGTPQSLDRPLYSLVFPKASVIAKSSCRDVEHAVSGIRAAKDLHWVRAFGIIDGDGRTPEDKERLRAEGIFLLDVFSVESIYYDVAVTERVAKRLAEVTGADVSVALANAKAAALNALRPHRQRLCEKVVEKSVRDFILRSLPGLDAISAGKPVALSIDVPTFVSAELLKFDHLLANEDLAALVRRYPVRETSALADIATRVGFKTRAEYEAAVRKLLIDEKDALKMVQDFFGDLATELSS